MYWSKPSSERHYVSISVSDLTTYVEEWIHDSKYRQHSQRTIESRQKALAHLGQWLEEQKHEVCGSKEVRSFLVSYGETGVRPVSVATYFSRIQTFFNFLVTEGILEVSPVKSLKRPVFRSNQVQPFDLDQIVSLLLAASKSKQPKRDRAILLLLLDTGIRASELCDLKASDVNLKGKRCVVLGKGNKKRTLYFGVYLVEALKDFYEFERDSSGVYLFESRLSVVKSKKLTTSGLRQLIERLGKVAEVEAVRCSPHTFRHTFAIEFLRNGGNIFTLKELLGHTTLAMVNKYLAIAQADLEKQHRLYSPADRLKKLEEKPKQARGKPRKGIEGEPNANGV